MASLKKTIEINAPVEKIFAYLNEPKNLLEIWPSLVDVRNGRNLPNGGTYFEYTYKMSGIRLDGTSEDTEIIPNRRMVTKSTGGVDGLITWDFEPSSGGTQLKVEFEYIVPVPLVGRLAEAIIVKMNEQEAETLLANLKTRMEV